MEPKETITQTYESEVDYGYRFTWSVMNFSKDFDVIESQEFSLEPLCTSKWLLILLYSPNDKKLKIGMRRTDDSTHTVAIDSNFTFRNSKEILFLTRSLKSSFAQSGETKFCEKPFLKPSSLKGVKDDFKNQFRLKKDDVLVIEGDIKISTCCKHNEPREKSRHELVSALISSYKERSFTDVNFVVGDEIVPAHKFILASRSPVFQRMFESDMMENANNQIIIHDIEKPILENFLYYLYTGSMPDLDTSVAVKLYSVADYYDVKSLKEMCRHLLLLDITETTICPIICIADLLNDEALYTAALTFFAKNFKSIYNTGKFQEICKKNVELAGKIIAGVVSLSDA